jgi:hypothetical protein
MNYMSKGAWRAVLALLLVLLVLSLPVFGANGLGSLLKSLGVSPWVMLQASFYLIGALFGLLAGYVFHLLARAFRARAKPGPVSS